MFPFTRKYENCSETVGISHPNTMSRCLCLRLEWCLIFGECSFLPKKFLFSAKEACARFRREQDALRVGIDSLLDDSNYLNYATETMPRFRNNYPACKKNTLV